MKKKLLTCFTALSLVLAMMSFVPAYAEADDIYFTTQDGIELTKAQYDNLTKVYTSEELELLPPIFIEQNKNDTTLKLVDSDEAYVVTKTKYDGNSEPVESISEEVSEAEARRVATLPETRGSSWSTSSKKISIKMILGASVSVKKVTLINEWIKLPSVRSFDVCCGQAFL